MTFKEFQMWAQDKEYTIRDEFVIAKSYMCTDDGKIVFSCAGFPDGHYASIHIVLAERKTPDQQKAFLEIVL
jgi:hypothetical protein